MKKVLLLNGGKKFAHSDGRYNATLHEAALAFLDRAAWTGMSILNCARSGPFSSDRTIREYCRDIWHVRPVPVRLLSEEDVKVGFLQ